MGKGDCILLTRGFRKTRFSRGAMELVARFSLHPYFFFFLVRRYVSDFASPCCCKSFAGCRLAFGGEAKLSEFRLGGVTKLFLSEALFVRHLKVPYQVHQMRNIPPCDFCAPDAIWTHQASVSVRRALWAQRRAFSHQRVCGVRRTAHSGESAFSPRWSAFWVSVH